MFEHLGYYKEYYVNGKFIGSLNCDKDREVIGYCGGITETLLNSVKLDNNKVIKKGVEVKTLLYPLCGKLLEIK